MCDKRVKELDCENKSLKLQLWALNSVLTEIDEFLKDHFDTNDRGGPNAEMRLSRAIEEARSVR